MTEFAILVEAGGSFPQGPMTAGFHQPFLVTPPKLWPKQPTLAQPAISKQAAKEAAKEKARPPPFVPDEENDPPMDPASLNLLP